MKITAVILALIAAVSAASVEQKSVAHYTYEDIREQELKCKADRNREWKYDAATNTWACPLQKYWALSITRWCWNLKVVNWMNNKLLTAQLLASAISSLATKNKSFFLGYYG